MKRGKPPEKDFVLVKGEGGTVLIETKPQGEGIKQIHRIKKKENVPGGGERGSGRSFVGLREEPPGDFLELKNVFTMVI